MRHRPATGRHVAGDAIARGIDRAAGRGWRAVAAEALRLVKDVCGLGIPVGIVAGHTVESIFALGIATAPRQGGGLKPDRAGVRGGHGAALGAVALPAEPDDRLAVSELGTSDGEVGQFGGDGFEMVTARAVASLATDPAVVRQAPASARAALGAVVWQSTHCLSSSSLRVLPSHSEDTAGDLEWPVVTSQTGPSA